MEKTAAQIADDVLAFVKISELLEEVLEEMEKEAMFGIGIGGMWNHVKKRLLERIARGDHRLMMDGIKKVDSVARARKRAGKAYPREWWFEVKDGGRKVGYVVGEGAMVKTIYKPSMNPRGVRLTSG